MKDKAMEHILNVMMSYNRKTYLNIIRIDGMIELYHAITNELVDYETDILGNIKIVNIRSKKTGKTLRWYEYDGVLPDEPKWRMQVADRRQL